MADRKDNIIAGLKKDVFREKSCSTSFKRMLASDAIYIAKLEKINLTLCRFAKLYKEAAENGMLPIANCEPEWAEAELWLEKLAQRTDRH